VFDDHRISRAGLLAGAALLAPGAALAQNANVSPKSAVWSKSYTASKGPVQLAVYRKRLGAPRPGERMRPVLILAHGSSVSALPTYDLVVPGAGEYSVMDVFARLGNDCGRSTSRTMGARRAPTPPRISQAAPTISKQWPT
jgi:hypothetical protein